MEKLSAYQQKFEWENSLQYFNLGQKDWEWTERPAYLPYPK